MNTKLIDASTDTIYLCMYKIATLVFSVEDQKIQMNGSNVISIEKFDNFEYNLRSILKLRLRVDLRQKMWILNNKDKIKCKFELDKFGMNIDVESSIIGDNNVWNEEFSVFLNDDDASIDVEALESTLNMNVGEFKENDIQDQDYFLSQELFEIYLYNSSLLKASQTNINAVFQSPSINGVVGRILTESKHKKVVMSPIENDKKWDDIILPSYPAYKELVYLDQYYGLYKRGASIYYDIDALYIINPNGKCTAFRKDEWKETNFIVTQQLSSTPGNGMVKKPDQKCYYVNIPEENVSIKKPAESKNVEYGDNLKVITSDDGKVTSSSNGKNIYSIYSNSTGNPYAESIIKARMNENNAILYITGDGFDMNAFSLNKEYHITFEDPGKQEKYGKGIYRIAYAHHSLVMQTQNYMKSSHHIALKRCN